MNERNLGILHDRQSHIHNERDAFRMSRRQARRMEDNRHSEYQQSVFRMTGNQVCKMTDHLAY